jgi:hypothetical protein
LVIPNTEILIFDGRDTVIKYTNWEGEISHKLDTGLFYKIEIKAINSLSSIDNISTKELFLKQIL